MKRLIQVCKDALHKSHEVINTLGDGGIIEVHDEYVTDISTKGDRVISNALIKFFRERKIPAVLYSEESGKIKLTENPKYTIVFDDIDGTDNYHRGRSILPFCTIITIFDSIKPNFEDSLVTGIIEHNSGRLWHAVRGQGCYLNGIKVTNSGKKTLDKRTLITVNHYGERYIFEFIKIFQKAWIKDFGSAGIHLAGISSGIFDAFISTSQKGHELGAGYLLIKESKGFLSDVKGCTFDKKIYDFNANYQIIAASTKELGGILLSELNALNSLKTQKKGGLNQKIFY